MPKYQVINIDKATKNYPYDRVTVVNEFDTREQAQAWQDKEDPHSQISSGVRAKPAEPTTAEIRGRTYEVSGGRHGSSQFEAHEEEQRKTEGKLQEQAAKKLAEGKTISNAERKALARVREIEYTVNGETIKGSGKSYLQRAKLQAIQRLKEEKRGETIRRQKETFSAQRNVSLMEKTEPYFPTHQERTAEIFTKQGYESFAGASETRAFKEDEQIVVKGGQVLEVKGRVSPVGFYPEHIKTSRENAQRYKKKQEKTDFQKYSETPAVDLIKKGARETYRIMPQALATVGIAAEATMTELFGPAGKPSLYKDVDGKKIPRITVAAREVASTWGGMMETSYQLAKWPFKKFYSNITTKPKESLSLLIPSADMKGTGFYYGKEVVKKGKSAFITSIRHPEYIKAGGALAIVGASSIAKETAFQARTKPIKTAAELVFFGEVTRGVSFLGKSVKVASKDIKVDVSGQKINWFVRQTAKDTKVFQVSPAEFAITSGSKRYVGLGAGEGKIKVKGGKSSFGAYYQYDIFAEGKKQKGYKLAAKHIEEGKIKLDREGYFKGVNEFEDITGYYSATMDTKPLIGVSPYERYGVQKTTLSHEMLHHLTPSLTEKEVLSLETSKIIPKRILKADVKLFGGASGNKDFFKGYTVSKTLLTIPGKKKSEGSYKFITPYIGTQVKGAESQTSKIISGTFIKGRRGEMLPKSGQVAYTTKYMEVSGEGIKKTLFYESREKGTVADMFRDYRIVKPPKKKKKIDGKTMFGDTGGSLGMGRLKLKQITKQTTKQTKSEVDMSRMVGSSFKTGMEKSIRAMEYSKIKPISIPAVSLKSASISKVIPSSISKGRSLTSKKSIGKSGMRNLLNREILQRGRMSSDIFSRVTPSNKIITGQRILSAQDVMIKQRPMTSQKVYGFPGGPPPPPPPPPPGGILPRFGEYGKPFRKTTKKKKGKRSYKGTPSLSVVMGGSGTILTTPQRKGKAFISPYIQRRI